MIFLNKRLSILITTLFSIFYVSCFSMTIEYSVPNGQELQLTVAKQLGMPAEGISRVFYDNVKTVNLEIFANTVFGANETSTVCKWFIEQLKAKLQLEGDSKIALFDQQGETNDSYELQTSEYAKYVAKESNKSSCWNMIFAKDILLLCEQLIANKNNSHMLKWFRDNFFQNKIIKIDFINGTDPISLMLKALWNSKINGKFVLPAKTCSGIGTHLNQLIAQQISQLSSLTTFSKKEKAGYATVLMCCIIYELYSILGTTCTGNTSLKENLQNDAFLFSAIIFAALITKTITSCFNR